MSKLGDENWAVSSAFQKFVKDNNANHISNFSLEQIRKADVALGNQDINQPFRRAMQNRISELEDMSQSSSNFNKWLFGTILTILAIIVPIILWYFS